MEYLNSLIDDDEPNDCLVIGIDFGTTYSGVAWATRGEFNNKQINLITSWPGNIKEEGKVPTEIWYDDDENIEWGYQIPIDAEPFRWFKLLMLHTEDLTPAFCKSDYLSQSRAKLEKSGRTAVDLIADYLRVLWTYTMATIERARGEDIVESLPIHVVITVPAIWKDYTRQAMKTAAKKAGILDPRLAGETKLSFAPEPEAAALPTLLEQGRGVQPENVYIICDAGGGTVDLISYEVQSTNPIVLREAVKGTGKYIQRLCDGRLGAVWKRLGNAGIKHVLKNEWEYGLKKQFKPGKSGKRHVVTLPISLIKGGTSGLNDTTREPHIKDGVIYFRDQDIEKAFEVVFTGIKNLVEKQVQSAVQKGLSITGIILVGGLGANLYLYDYLKSSYSKAGITVLQSDGTRPRTSICRGAVMKGFLDEDKLDGTEAPIRITSTVSRASYGIEYNTVYNPLVHLEEDKIWDDNEEDWKATNQMKWYLRRAQVVSKIEPVRLVWYKFLREEQFDGTLSTPLFQCDDEVPPKRLVSNVQKIGTLFCTLDVQYSDLPDFKKKKGVKRLKFEIEMVPSGASLEFSLYIDGRKQGTTSVEMGVE
ncbi:hypothetical protein F4678DRAFT_479977 [Xylaria arbuscula]|nr:hypothetical protein F4678DRAFT_479977 [Xylaria arbuscula]